MPSSNQDQLITIAMCKNGQSENQKSRAGKQNKQGQALQFKLYSHGLGGGEDGATHPVEVVHLRLKLGAMREGRLGRLRAVEVSGEGVVVGERDE